MKKLSDYMLLLAFFSIEVACCAVMIRDVQRFRGSWEGLLVVIICITAAFLGVQIVLRRWEERNEP